MAYGGREDHLFNNVSLILSYISRRPTKSGLIRSSHQALTLRLSIGMTTKCRQNIIERLQDVQAVWLATKEPMRRHLRA